MKLLKFSLIVGFVLLTQQVFAQDINTDASMQRGRTIYSSNCVSCHMVNGNGINNVYPSLAGADSLIHDIPGMLSWILNGDEVNGVSHSFSLTDQEAADLLNYIRNSWGNEAGIISPDEIQAAKENDLDES